MNRPSGYTVFTFKKYYEDMVCDSHNTNISTLLLKINILFFHMATFPYTYHSIGKRIVNLMCGYFTAR